MKIETNIRQALGIEKPKKPRLKSVKKNRKRAKKSKKDPDIIGFVLCWLICGLSFIVICIDEKPNSPLILIFLVFLFIGCKMKVDMENKK